MGSLEIGHLGYMMIRSKSPKSDYVVPPHPPSRNLRKQKKEPKGPRGGLMMIMKPRQKGPNEKRKGERKRTNEPELHN